MPDRDRLNRESWLLWEMAELRRRAEEASHRAHWWRQEARATREGTRQVIAQARGIVNRLAREVGPMAEIAPEFPLAAGAVTPLRAEAEAAGSGDFLPLWSGQAGPLGREIPAGELTRQLAADALARFRPH